MARSRSDRSAAHDQRAGATMRNGVITYRKEKEARGRKKERHSTGAIQTQPVGTNGETEPSTSASASACAFASSATPVVIGQVPSVLRARTDSANVQRQRQQIELNDAIESAMGRNVGDSPAHVPDRAALLESIRTGAWQGILSVVSSDASNGDGSASDFGTSPEVVAPALEVTSGGSSVRQGTESPSVPSSAPFQRTRRARALLTKDLSPVHVRPGIMSPALPLAAVTPSSLTLSSDPSSPVSARTRSLLDRDSVCEDEPEVTPKEEPTAPPRSPATTPEQGDASWKQSGKHAASRAVGGGDPSEARAHDVSSTGSEQGSRGDSCTSSTSETDHDAQLHRVQLVALYDYVPAANWAGTSLAVKAGDVLFSDVHHFETADDDWIWLYNALGTSSGYVPRQYVRQATFEERQEAPAQRESGRFAETSNVEREEQQSGSTIAPDVPSDVVQIGASGNASEEEENEEEEADQRQTFGSWARARAAAEHSTPLSRWLAYLDRLSSQEKDEASASARKWRLKRTERLREMISKKKALKERKEKMLNYVAHLGDKEAADNVSYEAIACEIDELGLAIAAHEHEIEQLHATRTPSHVIALYAALKNAEHIAVISLLISDHQEKYDVLKKRNAALMKQVSKSQAATFLKKDNSGMRPNVQAATTGRRGASSSFVSNPSESLGQQHKGGILGRLRRKKTTSHTSVTSPGAAYREA